MKSFLSLMFSFILLSTIVFSQPTLTIPYVESFNMPNIGVQVDVKCDGVKSYAFNKNHFTIFEDGKKINTFSIYCPDSTDQCCIAAAIVMDWSGSMGWPAQNPPYKKFQQAGSGFVRGMDNRCDYATVVRSHGGGNIEVVAPWTSDTATLQKGIFAPGLPSGGTAIFDLINAGIKQFNPDMASECRAVILVSDGGDNSSNISRDSSIAFAHKYGVRIFAINPIQNTYPDVTLQQICDATGGKLFYISQQDSMIKVVLEVRKLIRNHFGICQLQYQTNACADGFPHTVDVVLGQPDAFCGGNDSVRFTFTPPYVDPYLPQVKMLPQSIVLDSNGVGLIPVQITSDVDSIETYLNDFRIWYDATSLEILRVIKTGTVLEKVSFTEQSQPGLFEVLFSSHQTIALPSILCTLEVRWKNKTVPKASLHFYTSTMRARCHYVVMGSCEVRNKQLTGVNETQPSSIQISQCYPNPVGGISRSQIQSTSIAFSVDARDRVRVTLYNQLGRVVKTLTDDWYTEGSHILQIDTQSLPAGMYTMVFDYGKNKEHREFVVMK